MTSLRERLITLIYNKILCKCGSPSLHFRALRFTGAEFNLNFTLHILNGISFTSSGFLELKLHAD